MNTKDINSPLLFEWKDDHMRNFNASNDCDYH